MRTVHYLRSFSELSETFVYDSVRELARGECDVRVLVHERVNAGTRPFKDVHIVPKSFRWNPRRLWRKFLIEIDQGSRPTHIWPLERPLLQRAVERERPDVLHAHFGYNGVRMMPIAEDFDIPFVVTFYGYDISMLPKEEFWQEQYRKLWQTASAIVVLSNNMREIALELGAPVDKLHVVHLGRDLQKLTYRPPGRQIRHFISVGRLTDKKGHLDTLKAFRRLLDTSDRRVTLQIIGTGERREALTSYISDSGLKDTVTLSGALPNDEVIEALRAADAFILCSRTAPNGDKEGTPTVLLEAQAIGLPCVSTMHAGIPEMIPEENHRFLAAEGNVAEITEALNRLISTPLEELRAISDRGRIKVNTEFNLENEAAKLLAIYKRLQK